MNLGFLIYGSVFRSPKDFAKDFDTRSRLMLAPLGDGSRTSMVGCPPAAVTVTAVEIGPEIRVVVIAVGIITSTVSVKLAVFKIVVYRLGRVVIVVVIMAWTKELSKLVGLLVKCKVLGDEDIVIRVLVLERLDSEVDDGVVERGVEERDDEPILLIFAVLDTKIQEVDDVPRLLVSMGIPLLDVEGVLAWDVEAVREHTDTRIR